MYVFENHLKRRGDSDTTELSTTRELWKWTVPTGTVKVGDYPQERYVDNRWWCGWDIPNYHERLKKGELLPHTPWQKTRYFGSTEGVYDVWTNDNTSHWYSSNGWTSFSRWRITRDEAWAYCPDTYDQYVSAAAAAIYGNGYDALTAIAELGDVVKMWRGIGLRMLRFDLPIHWRTLPDAWLETRYGWRTLLYDILSLQDAIYSYNDTRLRYSERAGTTWSSVYSDGETYEKAHYYLDQTWVDKVTTSIRGFVTADIEVPRFQFNPLSTAWEIIPLSFVWDWFINVGRSLSALSFLATQQSYAASKSFKVVIERTFTSNIGETKSTFDSGTDSQTGSFVVEILVRRPCRVPIFPRIVVNLNTFKIFDLLSLLVQRLK